MSCSTVARSSVIWDCCTSTGFVACSSAGRVKLACELVEALATGDTDLTRGQHRLGHGAFAFVAEPATTSASCWTARAFASNRESTESAAARTHRSGSSSGERATAILLVAGPRDQ